MLDLTKLTPGQREFHEVFEDKGGIFPIQDSPIRELTDSLYTTLKSYYNDMPLINGDIILGISLDAFIRFKTKEATYFLGVTSGCWLLMLDMFAKMMATKSVLTGVGNISVLSDEKKILNALLGPRGFIQLDHDRMAVDGVTDFNDPIRKNYANAFLTLALEFVILHEMSHIIDGHLGYLIKSQNLTWSELKLDSNEPKMDLLTSQTLEMRADRIAVYHYYLKATGAIKIVDTIAEPLRPIYNNMESFLFNLVFVLYSFFRLMGFQDFDMENAKKQTHPPPLVRASMIIDAIIALREVHEVKKMDKEQFIEQLRNIVFHAEKAFCEITYSNYDPMYIATNLKMANNYKRSLYENYDGFEKTLQPYSIIQKSSPVNNRL